MSLSPAIIDAMLASGCTAEQLAAVMKAALAGEEERLADKRAKDAERQRRHRASRDVTVTPCDSTDSVTAPALSPAPKEINSNPHPHTHPIQTPRARKGHRLPDDWQPGPLPAELAAAVAKWPQATPDQPGALERELARFRDWAASANGPNAIKSNWDAAWRNWLRKAQDEGRYGERAKQPIPTGPRSIDRRDGVAVALDRRLGFDEPAGPLGRYDPDEGGSYRALPAPRLAAM